jgi:hypothetical protein
VKSIELREMSQRRDRACPAVRHGHPPDGSSISVKLKSEPVMDEASITHKGNRFQPPLNPLLKKGGDLWAQVDCRNLFDYFLL